MSAADENSGSRERANPFCRECGAANYAGATKCYLCGREFTEAERAALPRGRTVGQPQPTEIPSAPVSSREQAAPALPTARGPLTYSLSTLFLIVTLAGVCFGLVAAAPGLGILVAVLIVPAMIRTFAISGQQRLHGENPTTDEKIVSFIVSLAVMMAVVVAAGVAFFTACSAIGFGLGTLTRFDSPAFGIVILLALGAGLCAAVFVAVMILKRTWPHRNGKKKL